MIEKIPEIDYDMRAAEIADILIKKYKEIEKDNSFFFPSFIIASIVTAQDNGLEKNQFLSNVENSWDHISIMIKKK